MDIEYSIDNNMFTTRVSAIIYNQDKSKVLLFKVLDGRDYYLLPGGRIQFGEDSKSAIEREIKEEVNYDINFNLCAFLEVFLYKDNKEIIQYNFCYKGVYNGIIDDDIIKCIDNNNQIFEWVDITELANYKIYPESIKECILINDNKVRHYTEKIEL